VVQQWCDRTQSVNPLKMVIVPLTRKSGIITYLLTPWSIVLREKLTCVQLVKKFHEPECSLPHSQVQICVNIL
jgi:hypothetical protein